MKRLTRSVLAFFAIVSWTTPSSAQFFGQAVDESAVLTIHPDGSCSYTNISIASRQMIEQQVRQMESIQNMSDDDEANPASPAATNQPAAKALTDAELIKKLQDLREDSGQGDADQAVQVSITNSMVWTEIDRTFASLEEMLKSASEAWATMGIQNVRFEQDSNGLIRVTLTAPPDEQRYFKYLRTTVKMTGAKSRLQLIFPGKVVASSLPETDGNTTGVTLDGKKDETIDAFMKAFSAPAVITAEAGGLRIPVPLESKTLRRYAGRAADPSDDLPIKDAGPGFVAEARSLTTTALHVFPEGKDYFKDANQSAPGALIQAKFFVPKGRTLQSISDVKVLKAVDDKGRAIAPADAGREQGDIDFSSQSWGSRANDSASIQLALQLPLPDAQAINEVDAEAVAVTAGSWKEMMLTNLQANATNEIDLSDVLPGAKLTITKLTTRKQQTTIRAQVTGSPAVKQLKFEAKIPGAEQAGSSVSDLKFSTHNHVSKRAFYLQSYNFGGGEAAGPLTLVVRYPEDVLRERVRFKLTALDLF
jgi:hypothetical protein